MTESPESNSNGISEPKRRKFLAMFLLMRSYHLCKYANLKVGRDKVLRKNIQIMPSSSNSVGKAEIS